MTKTATKKAVIVLLLSILLLAPIIPFMLKNKEGGNYLAHGDVVLAYDDINKLEAMSEYGVGVWISPYIKIYSIGEESRIAEISNYPRAYKDTDPHVYEEDISFTVKEGDLNYIDDNGTVVYIDHKQQMFHVGEKATHYIGETLPGEFPLWKESEDLTFLPSLDKFSFPMTKVPGPIRQLTEVGLKVSDVYMKVDEPTLNTIVSDLSSGVIEFDRKGGDSDKQTIRIRYERVFDE